MGRKTVALSLDEDIYNKYKRFCEERGIILSKQVEFFMRSEIDKNNKGDKK